MKQIVKQGQSFLDKVIQITGNQDKALEVAIATGKSITGDLSVGEDINYTKVDNQAIASYFNEFNEPATATSNSMMSQTPSLGIGSMAIGNTFIVG